MHSWFRTGICALTMGAMLQFPALAAGAELSFDRAGENAGVTLTEVASERYAAQVTLSVTQTKDIQFTGRAESYAMTVRADQGEITLYAADRNPLSRADGRLEMGTLKVSSGTEITKASRAVVLDRSLERTEWADLALEVKRDTASSSEDGSDGESSSTPKITVQGEGGQVRAERGGRVVITPDSGYRIARILLNGKEIQVTNVLTGLSGKDRLVVYFEREETKPSTPSFTDVQPGDWYAGAVEFVVERGLFYGQSETQFAPQANMSRAMLVTVLYRLSGEKAPDAAGVFTDVPADAWYSEAVAWAYDRGVAMGVLPGQFAPDQNVTREQTAALLSRFCAVQGTPLPEGTLDFTDQDEIGSYARDAVASVQAAGLMRGQGEGRFAPKAPITRAEVAMLLMQYIQWSQPEN